MVMSTRRQHVTSKSFMFNIGRQNGIAEPNITLLCDISLCLLRDVAKLNKFQT